MRIASWNCQGIGKSPTVRCLKELCRRYLLDAIFLIETKQLFNYVCDLSVSIGFPNHFIVSPVGLSGGLALFWKNSIDINVVYHDARLVDCFMNEKTSPFYLSCIYCDPNPQFRSELWERLQWTVTTRNKPWLMLGDFNQIRTNSEKLGGHFRDEETFREFNTTLDICDMLELKHKGNKFSWSGNESLIQDEVRKTELIQCCLDKVLANTEWFSYYTVVEAKFLELVESDHRPLLVNICSETQVKRGLFRYDKRLFSREGFKEFIEAEWDQIPDTLALLSKLKRIRKKISQWK
ncbi:hypothetical protein V5N11_033096 [Cardamine amara subsp. amara]|uniref:Endonuclease/exonuclease/phosphatase domain-containing protein n=1 Tax=Cardamine amara subsp. amara TaxID=228776 RepID=A0ABD1BNS1_CARAN